MKEMSPRNCQLLLVEDDHLQLLYYTSLLQEEGFEVFPVNTPREAIGVLRTNHIDLIITDLNMPGADGIDFISHIRKNDIRSDGAACPVIIFSCDEMSDSKAIELGANRFCAKRDAREKLPGVVRSIISR